LEEESILNMNVRCIAVYACALEGRDRNKKQRLRRLLCCKGEALMDQHKICSKSKLKFVLYFLNVISVSYVGGVVCDAVE